ncbi:MAG: hypothetical protein HFG65_10075 [Hungatella sp.]|nr:hypothetical protein [Hungatella sp.]
MDLLQKCAQEFDRLVLYQYHIIIGRKGKTLEFTISFDRADFHHLAGLHKLRDNVILSSPPPAFLTGWQRKAHLWGFPPPPDTGCSYSCPTELL